MQHFWMLQGERPLRLSTFADSLLAKGRRRGACPALFTSRTASKIIVIVFLCMTCLASLPESFVQLNLRFPTTESAKNHQGNSGLKWPLLLLWAVVLCTTAQESSLHGFPAVPVDAQHFWSSA